MSASLPDRTLSKGSGPRLINGSGRDRFDEASLAGPIKSYAKNARRRLHGSIPKLIPGFMFTHGGPGGSFAELCLLCLKRRPMRPAIGAAQRVEHYAFAAAS